MPLPQKRGGISVAKKKKKIELTEAYIEKHRKFPVLNTVFLLLLVAAQIIAVLFAVLYEPQPQDRIDLYEITVEPLVDGTLDITYSLIWTPLDENEELTWIEIGMANSNYSVYQNSLSKTIGTVDQYADDEGYTYLRLDLDRAYTAGETLHISFKINQKNILCRNAGRCFYEFVPGWFNATPVEHYEFRWRDVDAIIAVNADAKEQDYFCWEGRLDCGEYVVMEVTYDPYALSGVRAVSYVPFDDSGAYNQLEENKGVAIFVAVVACVIALVFEVIIIDSYVSYHRGRGFIVQYGHHVHVCGRVNPSYRRAQQAHSGGGGFHGGGCACACACACAGGGRAGCSQKDTYDSKRYKEQ